MDQETIVLDLHMKGTEFGYEKRNMMGYRVESSSELLVCVQVILRAIRGETFVEIFSN
jgi:hypothetical protein